MKKLFAHGLIALGLLTCATPTAVLAQMPKAQPNIITGPRGCINNPSYYACLWLMGMANPFVAMWWCQVDAGCTL